MTYINIKTRQHGVETVDQVDPNDYDSHKSFEQGVQYLLGEYQLAYQGMGIAVYTSQQCDKTWNK